LNFETYHCDSCRKSFDYADVYGCYVLNDAAEVSVHSEYAWCNRCDDLVAAEHIPDLESLERALADVESNGLDDEEREFASLVETTPEKLLADRIAMWRNYVSWRSSRRSPPRCLKCGTMDVLLLERPFLHPSCGGTLEVESSGDYLPAGRFLYDAEGNRFGDSAVA